MRSRFQPGVVALAIVAMGLGGGAWAAPQQTFRWRGF